MEKMARIAALGACLPLAAAWTYPEDNLLMKYREQEIGEIPALTFLDGSMQNATRHTDIALSDPNLKLGGLEMLSPLLYPIEAENHFIAEPVRFLCKQYWWLSLVTATFYLLAVWLGQVFMASRKPFDLKGPLAVWNLLLAVYSFIGMVRVVPHLAAVLYTYGFEYSICRAAHVSYGNGAAGFWMMLFIFSKYVELIDTVFLVLRKKPVNFLHWYHHATVLMYCWHSYVFFMPTGIYFAAMNYSVHAIMYWYYFLAAVLPKPPKWATMVTILQLTQMVGGIVVTMCHLSSLVFNPVPRCDGYVPNLAGALTMYASYFGLFAQFFYKRYCAKRAPKDGKDGKMKKQL